MNCPLKVEKQRVHMYKRGLLLANHLINSCATHCMNGSNPHLPQHSPVSRFGGEPVLAPAGIMQPLLQDAAQEKTSMTCAY